MKIVKRIGVFETNSSSTHSLILISKDELSKQDAELKKYHKLTDKKDKLILACECCYEMFVEDRYMDYMSEKANLNINNFPPSPDAWFFQDDLTFETMLALLVGEYCELTGESFGEMYAQMDDRSRNCRDFFREGALFESEDDYYKIYDLFHGTVSDIKQNIKNYLDDDNVLCYLEYWQGHVPLYANDDEN